MYTHIHTYIVQGQALVLRVPLRPPRRHLHLEPGLRVLARDADSTRAREGTMREMQTVYVRCTRFAQYIECVRCARYIRSVPSMAYHKAV